ncbi:MAG TPA: TIGR04282 family arsenosugar biosynthesis glycosyltransferase [Burkholderiales bacterium]|nr:TIGR04282 family arsenosugar biosynthesis glycosyltransferase [Burkholderiales bacterium]
MRVIVFAKAPVPGAVKTRLIPALGAAGAARFHEWLVERALETACAARLGPVELCCAPDRAHPFFAACAARFDVSLTDQGTGDLGERMHRALAAGLPALLIGADCPAMTPEYLRDGAGALTAGYDVVLGPAEDGGYVLVGASRIRPDAFARIRWGGQDVMAEQRERLRSIGWRWQELALLWDVDRPDDLERVRREVPGGAGRLNALAPREGAGENRG